MQVEPPGGPQDPRSCEVRALQQHVRGFVGDLGRRPAHDAGERDRLVEVADQQVLVAQLALDVVEGREALALTRAPHHDPRAGQEVQVEPVERLTELEHRVVRGVDDVRHGAHAGCGEPGLHAQRTVAVRVHAPDHAREVSRASVGRVEAHRGDVGRGLVALLERQVGLDEGHAGRGRDLARHPEHAQEVGPVRLDLDVEHRVVEPERDA